MAQEKNIGPGTSFVTITPSDSVVYNPVLRSIYVGVGGNIAIVGLDGVIGIAVNVPQGTVFPVEAVQVMATNTTASSLLGFR